MENLNEKSPEYISKIKAFFSKNKNASTEENDEESDITD